MDTRGGPAGGRNGPGPPVRAGGHRSGRHRGRHPAVARGLARRAACSAPVPSGQVACPLAAGRGPATARG
eukprot:3033351-Lingulodinium_polyedra.AAC.1